MFNGFGVSPEMLRPPKGFVAPSGLVTHLDGPQITGLAGGAAVASWTQPLGNVSQGTAAKRPTYTLNALNNKNAPVFATDDWLAGPAVPIAGPFTIFVAGNVTLTGIVAFMLECGEVGTNSTNYYFYYNFIGGVQRLEGGFYNGATFQGFADPRTITTGPFVARLRYTGTVLDIWRNGVSSGTPISPSGTPTIAGSQQLFVGSQRSAAGASVYNGVYGTLQIYNRSLSDGEARYVEQSLGSEWGVAIT